MGKRLKIEKIKKKGKWNLLKSGDEIIDGNLLKGAHTEIFGDGKITVDGCMGVCEYRDTYLKIKLSKGALIICGEGFDIVYFENRLITVKGKISSLEFSV